MTIGAFQKIVEDRIRRAQERGDFNDLPGSGKPLKLEDDHTVPEELRMAHKILKNADCLPPELEIKREIRKTEDLLTDMEETAEKYRTLKKLNYLIMKLNSLRSASIQFDVPQKYMPDLVTRIESASASSEKQKA